MFNKEETIKYLLKGITDADEQAIREKVEEVYDEGRTLRIKFGMDPSSPDIHLGHAVSLRKVNQKLVINLLKNKLRQMLKLILNKYLKL